MYLLAAIVIVMCSAGVLAFMISNSEDSGGLMVQGQKPQLSSEPLIERLELPPPPPHLKFWGVQASILLDFAVDVSGKVKDVKVLHASHFEIVRPIINAVENADVSPALSLAGEPVEVRMQLPLQTGQQIPENLMAPKSRAPQKRKPKLTSIEAA